MLSNITIKNVIIFVVALTNFVFSQIIVENFNDFSGGHISENLKGKWVFSQAYHDNISGEPDITRDVSGNNHDLSLVGWANIEALTDSLKGSNNPVYLNGDTLSFQGTSYFSLGSHSDFNPSTTSFSVVYWINETGVGDLYQFSKYSVTNSPYYAFKYDDGDLDIRLRDDDGTIINTALLNASIEQGGWNFVANIVNRTTNTATGYQFSLNNSIDISALTTDAITPSGAVNIGSLLGAGTMMGSLANVVYYNKALTPSEVNEELALAVGWVSKNGKVTRNSSDFFQTFFDTIGIAIPSSQTLGSTQEFKLSLQAKSGDASKILKAWIGRSDYAKAAVQTKTVTSVWTTYNFNLGNGYSLSTADTLWFATNALTDTVSIDNVVLSKGQHNLYTPVRKWPGW